MPCARQSQEVAIVRESPPDLLKCATVSLMLEQGKTDCTRCHHRTILAPETHDAGQGNNRSQGIVLCYVCVCKDVSILQYVMMYSIILLYYNTHIYIYIDRYVDRVLSCIVL